MRKESLKKNGNKNGVVDDGDDNNDNDDMNGIVGAIDNQDPLQGEEPILEVPKKKGRKKNDTVTEVAVPIANNADDDYEVEDIIDHKYEKKVRLFLVRWKNCSPEEDTWEPETSLSCPEIVQNYIDNNPDAEVQSSASRKRPANKKEKSVVPAKKSKGKKAASNAQDGDEGDDVDNDNDADGAEDEEFEVEDIVDHKIVKGKTSFLIRWKNYDSSGDTWEPELSLSCPEIIQRYKEEKMKDTPKTKGSKKEPKPKKEKAEKDYEVQSISDEKTQGGIKYYLVRWKGYKVDDDSWEPEDSLNCPEIISKFQEFKKNKRESGKRGTPKKPLYAEIDETEGEDASVYVNGSTKQRTTKAAKGKAAKGKAAKGKAAKGKAVKGKAAKGKATAQKKQKEEEEDDYEVEEIAGEKMEKGKKYYFLKWKGFAASSNTWELASSLSCPDVLNKYLAKQKSTPKPKASKLAKSKAGKSKASGKKSKSSKSPEKSAKTAKKNVVEEEQDWEVEKITDVRYNENGTKDFLIRWKGCDPSQDTWEPEDNVDSPDLVSEFMNRADVSDEVEVTKKKSRKV